MKDKYAKTEWIDGKTKLTSDKLNNIEEGIANLFENALSVSEIYGDDGILVDIVRHKDILIHTKKGYYLTAEQTKNAIAAAQLPEKEVDLSGKADQSVVDEILAELPTKVSLDRLNEILEEYAKKNDVLRLETQLDTKLSKAEAEELYQPKGNYLTGGIVDISGKADKDKVYSKEEADKKFLTSHQDISGKLDKTEASQTYATKTDLGATNTKVSEINTALERKADKSELFSGNYQDLKGIPEGLATEDFVISHVSTKADTEHTHTLEQITGLNEGELGKVKDVQVNGQSVLGEDGIAKITTKEPIKEPIKYEVALDKNPGSWVKVTKVNEILENGTLNVKFLYDNIILFSGDIFYVYEGDGSFQYKYDGLFTTNPILTKLFGIYEEEKDYGFKDYYLVVVSSEKLKDYKVVLSADTFYCNSGYVPRDKTLSIKPLRSCFSNDKLLPEYITSKNILLLRGKSFIATEPMEASTVKVNLYSNSLNLSLSKSDYLYTVSEIVNISDGIYRLQFDPAATHNLIGTEVCLYKNERLSFVYFCSSDNPSSSDPVELFVTRDYINPNDYKTVSENDLGDSVQTVSVNGGDKISPVDGNVDLNGLATEEYVGEEIEKLVTDLQQDILSNYLATTQDYVREKILEAQFFEPGGEQPQVDFQLYLTKTAAEETYAKKGDVFSKRYEDLENTPSLDFVKTVSVNGGDKVELGEDGNIDLSIDIPSTTGLATEEFVEEKLKGFTGEDIRLTSDMIEYLNSKLVYTYDYLCNVTSNVSIINLPGDTTQVTFTATPGVTKKNDAGNKEVSIKSVSTSSEGWTKASSGNTFTKTVTIDKTATSVSSGTVTLSITNSDDKTGTKSASKSVSFTKPWYIFGGTTETLANPKETIEDLYLKGATSLKTSSSSINSKVSLSITQPYLWFAIPNTRSMGSVEQIAGLSSIETTPKYTATTTLGDYKIYRWKGALGTGTLEFNLKLN